MINKKGTRVPAQQFIKNILSSQKRSVSPIIATILLIALVIIIALIVFQWTKGFTKEAITKFDGTNIDLVCNDIQFDASYSGGNLVISNIGNVPVYDFDVRSEYPGGHETADLTTLDSQWSGIMPGGIYSKGISISSGTTTITLIPILLGVNKDGEQKTQACDKRQGKEIFI